MIPKSGNRFSDKIMLKQKAKAKPGFDLESFRFSAMLAHCAAEGAACWTAADRRVRDRRVFDGA
jgi:hypothetical protein